MQIVVAWFNKLIFEAVEMSESDIVPTSKKHKATLELHSKMHLLKLVWSLKRKGFADSKSA